ncbi:MAG: hypothetical protein AABY13_00995, partial [Nanoarchaeota archaeon]
MDKRLPLVCIAVILCALSVSAFEFGVKLSPESGVVRKGETAYFNVTVTHTSDKTEVFSVYSPDVQWDVPSTTVNVPAGEAGTARIAVKQYDEKLNPGYYLVNLHVRPNSQDSVIRTTVLVSLRSDGITKYLPSLRVTPDAPTVIDPRVDAPMSVKIDNLNKLQVDNIVLKLRSNLINKDIAARVGPLNSTTVTLLLDLPDNALHQEDRLLLSAFVTADNQTYRFDAAPLAYEVAEYGEIAADVQKSKTLLTSTKTITLTNTGNAQKATTYTVKKQFFRSWFVNTEPAARIIKTDEGKSYAWDVTLPVGGSTTIKGVTDWTSLAIIIIMALVIYGLYYLLRSPIIVE